MAGRRGRKGNGEGNIRQRSDGRWEARLALPNGRSKSLYGQKRIEVARRLAAAIRDRDHGMVVALDERQTVGQYLTAWLETIRPTVKPRTHQRYERAVRVHLIPSLGSARRAAGHRHSSYPCPRWPSFLRFCPLLALSLRGSPRVGSATTAQ